MNRYWRWVEGACFVIWLLVAAGAARKAIAQGPSRGIGYRMSSVEQALNSIEVSPLTFLPFSVGGTYLNIADGNSHPISGLYSTCAAAHAAYSFIASAGCDLTMQFSEAATRAAYASIPYGTIKFPPGRYKWSGQLAMFKPISIQGFSSELTKFFPVADVTPFSYWGCGTPAVPVCSVINVMAMGRAGISKLSIVGDGSTPGTGPVSPGTQTKPAIILSHIALPLFEDLSVYGWGGSGIEFTSVWDARFYHPYFAIVGHDDTSPFWNFKDSGGVDNEFYNNNNIITFGGHFEHSSAPFIKSSAINADGIKFFGAKFEGQSTSAYIPFQITAKSFRWEFVDCVYNNLSGGPETFYVTNTDNSKFTGTAYNSDPYTTQLFISFVNSSNNRVASRGYHQGGYFESGNSRYNQFDIHDEFNQSGEYLTNIPAMRAFDIRKLGGNNAKIVDDGTAPLGFALTGASTDYSTQFEILVNQANIAYNGQTVHFYSKSSTSQVYAIVMTVAGVDTTIGYRTVGTAWTEYQISIPHQFLSANAKFRISATAGQAGIVFSLGSLYWEDRYYTYGAACPGADGTSWTWAVGDVAYWPQPVASATNPQLCQCTAAGASGTWKRVGGIDPFGPNTYSGLQTFANDIFVAGTAYIANLSITGGATFTGGVSASSFTTGGAVSATGNGQFGAVYSGGTQIFPAVAGSGIGLASGTITNTKQFNGCSLGGNVTVCTNSACTTTASVPTTITCP